MPVEFLDPPMGAPASRPAAVASFEFLPAEGVDFLEDPPQAASAEELGRRFLDPAYEPTLAEFKIYDQARKNRTLGQRLSENLERVGEAASGIVSTIVGAAKAIPRFLADPESNDLLLSAAEGVARGTKRDVELVAKLLPGFGNVGNLNFDEFIAVKVANLNQEKFKTEPLSPQNVWSMITRHTVSPATLSAWRREYDEEYIPKADYARFLQQRQAVRSELELAQGKRTLLAGEGSGAIMPEVADATSLVASPLALVPFGKALTPAKTVARAVAAKTLEGAGKTFEWLGEKTVQAATVPERAAGAAARLVSGTEEAGAKATETVASGIAGISTAPFKAAGKAISEGGEAAAAGGRAVAEGPSRYGVFDRIVKDSAAPQWLRRVASIARPLDPAIAATGIATKGAVEGASVGGVLGGLTEGEEGAASGVGAGLALGAGGALAGRALGGRRYADALKDIDVARWLASKSDDEIRNIRALGLSREQAVALSDVERLAHGVVSGLRPESGDVEFRYIDDRTFAKMFGGIGKGAQLLEGDRPVIFINTGYKGPRSAFHEVMHALDALEDSSPQRQALNRVLFDQALPDGTPLSRGVFSSADLDAFTGQYRSRLNESARSEFDLLTPEDRQNRIMAEVRAESFSNLLAGNPRSAFPGGFRGVRQRVADALLAAEHDSALGKMRRALESAGVRFDASGAPSELFVKNGRPITNTPSVDAALRDYLRAKDNLTRRLNAGDDEAPQFVVTPQDLLSKASTGLVRVFQDSDIFSKNPDGTVKLLGGVPVLLSEGEIRAVQARRVDAMLAALDAVPDLGQADLVRKKPNGAYEGKYFSDRQLAALRGLADEILSPSMKGKLDQLNALARQDGAQIILDYNAALKGRRYSSGIAPTTRGAVPLTFNISKAGNFYMATLDTSHFFRKLSEWRRSRPKAFAPWDGDPEAFLRAVFAYLDNHVNGRPGSVNLDADPAMAVHKKNVINDFFNVPKGKGNEDLNPVQLSGLGQKDNLIRARRFDRINRITPGAGDRFPIRYELQKRNFLPAGPVKASDNKLRFLNEVWAVRYRNEEPWEVAVLSRNAPRGLELVNPGFKNYKALITRSPKDPKFPWQTTWWYDDGADVPIPVGDRATTTYEDAVRVALNAGFTQESLLAPAVRNRYAREYANALPEAESSGAQGVSAQAGSQSGNAQAPRATAQGRQAQSAARTAAVNFLPASAVAGHVRAQAEFDLTRKMSGPPAATHWLAQSYWEALAKRFRSSEQIHAAAAAALPQELQTAVLLTISRGRNAAMAYLDHLALMEATRRGRRT